MPEQSTHRSPILPLALVMLAAAVLNSVLIVIRAALSSTTAILVLYYACQLLSLFVTMVGIGAALFYLSRKMNGRACRLIWLTEAITLIPLLAAAIQTAINNQDYLADVLIIELISAIGNTLLMAAMHFLLLLLCWLFFFKGRDPLWEEPRFSLRKNRLGWANLTVAGLLFLYQAIVETIETVDFIKTYWPNVYRNEIASMIFSYVFLLLSLLLGYFIQHGTQALLHTPNE